MCKCTPGIKTPFCGRGDCVWPRNKKTENQPIPNRFDYIEYDKIAQMKQGAFKKLVVEFEASIETFLPFDKATIANKTKAMNHLEMAYAWLGKAIRDEQIARNGSATLMEERTDS